MHDLLDSWPQTREILTFQGMGDRAILLWKFSRADHDSNEAMNSKKKAVNGKASTCSRRQDRILSRSEARQIKPLITSTGTVIVESQQNSYTTGGLPT